MSENKYRVEKKTLTQLTEWMNSEFGTKKSGEPFKVSDVQKYVERGNVPSYLGGFEIMKDTSPQFKDLKVYNVLEKD